MDVAFRPDQCPDWSLDADELPLTAICELYAGKISHSTVDTHLHTHSTYTVE